MSITLSCNEQAQDIPCPPNEDGTSWLKEKIESMEKALDINAEIYTLTYNGNTVIEINDCLGCADAMTVVYDCAGNELCKFGGIAGFNTCPDFADKATNRKLYWED